MKLQRLFELFSISLVALALNSCASKDKPGSYEATVKKQEDRFDNYLEKRERKSETRKRKWDNYSRNADAKYSSWIDKMMD